MTDDKIEVLLMWVTGKSPGGKGFGDKIEVVTESKVTKSRYYLGQRSLDRENLPTSTA